MRNHRRWVLIVGAVFVLVLVGAAVARAGDPPIQEKSLIQQEAEAAGVTEQQVKETKLAEQKAEEADAEVFEQKAQEEKAEAKADEQKAKQAEKKAEEAEKQAKTKCHLEFSLHGWSVFYKQSKGEGTISCDNGQKRHVAISAHGGGVTFGKSSIVNGHGSFSKVEDIKELFGSYATSEAHAGIVGSAGAQAMTKGHVSLALSGTGKGYNLGFDFGSFKITPKK
jgi:hypothetical protein